jgi:RHS repeat-associated protein
MSKIKQLLTALSLVPALCVAQTATENYVMTETMLDSTASTSIKSVQYYNGLGYPTLSVATSGIGGETAYTLTTYDALGREIRKYVPVPGTSLEYIAEDEIKSRGYFYQDNSGFTENHYDALDRVTAVDIAGDKWRNAGKQNRTEYLANTSDDKVLHYEAPDDNSYRLVYPENTSFQYYPEGTLSKVVSYDADDKAVTVFTDLLGQKILERTAAGDTYYVYNILGQLRFVLSPAFNKNTRSTTMFAYEYRYDSRGRLKMKILPGSSIEGSTTQYWYDKADRMAYMKDPALGNRYRFYLYDKFGRLCVQGICSGGNRSESILSTTIYGSASGGICQTGYSAPYTITDPQLEIVNYYDGYDFIGTSLTSAMPTVSITQNQRKYSIGSQTGQVVYATNGEALGSINVYDQKGQVVRTVRKGLKGYIEEVNTVYTFTGAVDNTTADVNVKYGSHFVATANYTYQYGKKTNMALSVSHGSTARTRETDYIYDAIGRMDRKDRQLARTAKSSCSYSYDVHGWLTSLNSGGFQEQLYYADGLDGECYNGNISTMKWKMGSDNSFQGYNLKYDGNNRLTSAVFGTGNNLTGNKDYFSESADYDCNGNITSLRRSGLVNKIYGGFGLVDNLNMTYEGNMLTSVRDNASHQSYAGATDFDGVAGQEYPLTYNAMGSLTSDAGRKIAKIDYDYRNNPVRIQFTNGNVTKYVYSATGEKLRVIYQTAVPNITVAIGNSRELARSEIQYTDSTDYLLGGSLTVKNGRIDKYQFDEGYCQAEKNSNNTSQDDFTFCYYDRDHLGNIRQVTQASGKGTVIQTMNYYPFGAQFCDGSACNSDVQSRKYNGKEFDKMHGLNTYDYGARQYNPVTGRWDRVDQLTEKNPNMTPFHFCHDNPMNRVDPDGRADYFSNTGKFISSDNNPKDPYIYIQNKAGKTKLADYNFGNDKKGLTAMMRIAFHYGKSVGATQKGTSVGVDAGMPAGTDSKTLAYTTDDHHIRLMVKDGHFKDNMSQIFNMRSTLRHESYHDKGEKNNKDSEVKTLINEINHLEFNKTTDSFQKSTLKLLQDNLIILYEKSADSFNELINQAKEILEKHGMNGTPSYHDGGNSISF